ncbi:sensor histidine kinase [Streptomyces sp. NBC_01304]|uniref:sensor histidine kinase n=1 Tax=Streptomyces sp. NBC_01304 TaxID=2903818 RepID=UPI002E1299EA|nr:histidine kinase [Streptomyces sp. NBC_01304]
MARPRAALGRLYRAAPAVQDSVLAVALLLPDLFLFSDFALPHVTLADRLVTIAYAVVGYAALAGRRRAPRAVFGYLWAHALGGELLTAAGAFDYSPTLALLAALYTVAALRSARLAALALGSVVVPVALSVRAALADVPAAERLTSLIGVACFYGLLNLEVWAVGRWVQAGRAAAARDRLALARAQEAVLAERARTARELHDIVANAVTVMVLQAGGARHVLRADPDRVEGALDQIESSGKTAVAELRHMLLVLRTDGERLAAEGPSFGLADLDPLLNGVRQAGLDAQVEVTGVPARLARSVDLTAYRLVQEALTNAAKHAGPGAATVVRLDWARAEGRLAIEVGDDGRGTPATARSELSTGHGLIGLRERVAVCGGTFDAGPLGDGGFRVAATLPTQRNSRQEVVS